MENLYYMVLEHFDNTNSYHRIRLECWEKQNSELRKIGCTPKNHSLYVDHLQGDESLNFTRAYERAECGERAISNFCTVLNIDRDKLYHLVKSIRKWHDKRNWQVCFPFTEKNNRTILNYLQA